MKSSKKRGKGKPIRLPIRRPKDPMHTGLSDQISDAVDEGRLKLEDLGLDRPRPEPEE